ncbi:hypothetical protein GM708_06625 [Vibrio cholerae]|nr:hypothetical protein [Vibrio cholerae]
MDSSVFWDAVVAVVAVAALAVSLYNLRQTRRAPALARQRELQDQVRALLDPVIAKLKAARSEIRRGSTSFPVLLVLDQDAQRISQIRVRLTKLDGRVALVEAQLRFVMAAAWSVESVTAKNESIETLARSGGTTELTPSNSAVAIQDLDLACKDAIDYIEQVLGELNRLENS